VTFSIVKVTAVSSDSTKVYYQRPDGSLDSIWDLSAALVDSIMRYNDGMIAPDVLPGGYVDAVTAAAQRPSRGTVSQPITGSEILYDWPLTTGATVGASPLVCDMDSDDTTDLVALSAGGWVFRWELPDEVLKRNATSWAMAGCSAERPFAYLGAAPSNEGGADTLGFYAYPNPAVRVDQVVFRYAFGAPATNVRIDVFTYTGNLVYSWSEPSAVRAVNYPDWNEHTVSLLGFGPAVYRCRLGAKVNGKEVSRFWKLAVVK
jgi:hypothetical protein